jgi:RNA polymerase sigma-70 factor (ECF subfamily)
MLGSVIIGIRFLVAALAASMPSTEVDWRDQLERLGAGEVEALARVRRLITAQLSRFGRYASRDSWDDVAQEVVIRVWRSHRDGKIRDYAAFPGFLRVMTRNTVIDAARRRRDEASSDVIEEIEDPLTKGTTLGVAETLALRNALGHLSDRHREVVESIYLEGRTYDETAAALQKPRGTINRLQREAMKQLRDILFPDS